ncbi:MAG: hypothetical protein L3J39_17085 [Verrucomicrobiales bacterium]|nr:hypothetical protein [Verrucomicrobiales bacterium]
MVFKDGGDFTAQAAATNIAVGLGRFLLKLVTPTVFVGGEKIFTTFLLRVVFGTLSAKASASYADFYLPPVINELNQLALSQVGKRNDIAVAAAGMATWTSDVYSGVYEEFILQPFVWSQLGVGFGVWRAGTQIHDIMNAVDVAEGLAANALNLNRGKKCMLVGGRLRGSS